MEKFITRINTIDPQDLTDEWLFSEWRELPRIVNELIDHPKRFVWKDIPAEYTLGKGHVKFMRNKLLFLAKRHASLIAELDLRGMKYNVDIVVQLDKLTPALQMIACKDWCPTKRDHTILIERLDERFYLRKKKYHMTTCNNTKSVVNCDETYNEYKVQHLDKYV